MSQSKTIYKHHLSEEPIDLYTVSIVSLPGKCKCLLTVENWPEVYDSMELTIEDLECIHRMNGWFEPVSVVGHMLAVRKINEEFNVIISKGQGTRIEPFTIKKQGTFNEFLKVIPCLMLIMNVLSGRVVMKEVTKEIIYTLVYRQFDKRFQFSDSESDEDEESFLEKITPIVRRKMDPIAKLLNIPQRLVDEIVNDPSTIDSIRAFEQMDSDLRNKKLEIAHFLRRNMITNLK